MADVSRTGRSNGRLRRQRGIPKTSLTQLRELLGLDASATTRSLLKTQHREQLAKDACHTPWGILWSYE
jgi:hypothetical protein